ncbi:MAG: response regulator, partial [Lachnospiraceae bacterium]
MLRVMLVDDEKVIAKGLSVLIDWKSEGCEIVKIAYDGLEALDYLRNESVDLIIADIRMPGMNG